MTVPVTELEGGDAVCGCGHRVVERADPSPASTRSSPFLPSPYGALNRNAEKASCAWQKRSSMSSAARQAPHGGGPVGDERSSSITSALSGVSSWFQTTYFGRRPILGR